MPASRSSDSSAATSSSRRSSSARCDVAAEQAGDRRLGGGQRGAQVVADGGEQGGAHLVGLGQRCGLRGSLAQPDAVADHGAPGPRRRRAAAGPRPRAVRRAAPGRRPSPAGTSVSASLGAAQAGPALATAVPAIVVASRAGSPTSERRSRGPARASAGSASSPPRTLPARLARVRDSAAARAAWRVRRAARSTAELTSVATSDEDEQRERVVRLADGEGVQRRGEVVVEQHRASDRGDQAGARPPTRATTTVSSRNSSMSLTRFSSSPGTGTSARVRSGGSSDGSASPRSRRRRLRLPRTWGRPAHGRVRRG